MRRRTGGALARVLGWAVLASLSSLLFALIVGVGAFRVLADPEPRAVEVVPAQRHPELLVAAMRRNDLLHLLAITAHAAASTAEAAEDGRAARAPDPEPRRIAPGARQMQAEALAAARPAARPPESNVRTQAIELRLATRALKPGERVQVTVSFYYCEEGGGGSPAGDGGGFCGFMRDGTRVFSGAAACAQEYLGQLFKILDDPTGRIYKCADTGSAVHGLHRDIWFRVNDDGWEWQRSMGRLAVIEILP